MVAKILVFALIVGTASAAVWVSILPEKPTELARKEGCYIEEVNDVVPFGSVVTPLGKCVRIECSSNLIDYTSCNIPRDDPYCSEARAGDVSKPYPGCCPIFMCS